MSVEGRFDFFLSRRGSVAALAQEVADVLTDKGYTVVVQDYDIPLTANFIEAMHEAIKNARDLVVLYTSDYEASAYTRRNLLASKRIERAASKSGASSSFAAMTRHCAASSRPMCRRTFSVSTTRRSDATHSGGGGGPVPSPETPASTVRRRAAAYR